MTFPPPLWLIAQATPDAGSSSNALLYLTALVGAVAGIGGIVVQFRTSRTAASQGYVDQNLRAQQARIDGQEAELVILRERDRSQRARIAEVEADNARLHTEVANLRTECDECLHRVEQLEGRHDPDPG